MCLVLQNISSLLYNSINIRREAFTHSCWTGNLGRTARHREPGLLEGEDKMLKDSSHHIFTLVVRYISAIPQYVISYISQTTL